MIRVVVNDFQILEANMRFALVKVDKDNISINMGWVVLY